MYIYLHTHSPPPLRPPPLSAFPVMFVRASSAGDYLSNISTFLGIKETHFPPPDAVHGDLHSPNPEIPSDALEKLQATYLSLRVKYEQEGDIFVLSPDSKPRDTVLVVSVGGEGTTSFIDMLTRAHVSCNHIWDDDGLKHR